MKISNAFLSYFFFCFSCHYLFYLLRLVFLLFCSLWFVWFVWFVWLVFSLIIVSIRYYVRLCVILVYCNRNTAFNSYYDSLLIFMAYGQLARRRQTIDQLGRWSNALVSFCFGFNCKRVKPFSLLLISTQANFINSYQPCHSGFVPLWFLAWIRTNQKHNRPINMHIYPHKFAFCRSWNNRTTTQTTTTTNSFSIKRIHLIT